MGLRRWRRRRPGPAGPAPAPRRPGRAGRLGALTALAAATALLAGCGGGADPAPTDARPSSAGPTGLASPTATATDDGPDRPRRSERERPPLRGIDASHHQGAIDWTAVAGDDVAFAYLKASEGTTFVDPAFAAHRREAADAGLRVGGYHYFAACAGGSPAADQAAHFVDVLERDAPRDAATLPPAIDVEIGTCTTVLDRPTLLAEVRSFVDVVERALDERVVVYLFPDVEERYGLAADLDRRQWVRRLGSEPPARDWWMWQTSDSATVDGVTGPVDLDLLHQQGSGGVRRPRGDPAGP